MIVKVSAKSMRQLFKGCNLEYITTVCKGRCCEGTKGISVAVHPSEEQRITSLGGHVENGLLRPDSRGLCPFKEADGLCRIHTSKPVGCIVSPFTLNVNKTVVVRNRYRLLRCYKGGTLPAYIAFFHSLETMFGRRTAQQLKGHLDAGFGDVMLSMLDGVYDIMTYNNATRGANNGNEKHE